MVKGRSVLGFFVWGFGFGDILIPTEAVLSEGLARRSNCALRTHPHAEAPGGSSASDVHR